MHPVRLIRSLSVAGATWLLLSQAAMASDVIKLTGAGASFPAPLYQRWFRDYYLTHPDVRVDYQAIGSGGGIAGLIGGRLDFAGSDLPMTREEAEQVEGGVIQIPMTAGAVVLAYNLPGIQGLRLSREAVSAIFLGRAGRWNDPVIQAANPGVDLPDMPIVLVARADASGTTYVITRHLSAISPELAESVGTTMSPAWPKVLQERGALIRGQGNGGVAAYVQAVPGAIGYVQFAYAHQTGMQVASVQNQAGEFVPPSGEAFRAAVESFRAELDLSQVADPRGAGSYPILTLSWLIARRDYDDQKSAALTDVIRYALTEGQAVADLLGYIPLTEQAVRLILQDLEQIDSR
ncbi:MAG: phosphate ABC transporter substrate-binding protein PstS [Thiocapsa sp.]|nr:phosphate ABC transporter substrate-binding protein PstS [Thiocapsa sp.]MCG6897833.1 phosphate ABC transporter substrate-binding protein PstS [Thiocapsa sp.]MCG6985152.1 phosphate ABC transporter substrate-binding protein PstS [Thiocapsa sp.]